MNVKVRTVKRKTCTLVVLDYVDLYGKRCRPTVGKARAKRDLKPILQEAEHTAKRFESILCNESKYYYFLEHLVRKTFWPVQRACMLLLDEVEFRRYTIIKGVECQFRVPNDHPIVLSLMEETRRFQHFDGKRGFKPIPTEDGVAVLREDFVKFAVRPEFGDRLPDFVKNLEDFVENAVHFGFEDLLPDSVEKTESVADGTESSIGTPNEDGLRKNRGAEHTELQLRIIEELSGEHMTEPQLTKRLKHIRIDIARVTVKKALDQLRKSGRIANKRGLGYYLPESPPQPSKKQ